MQHADGERTRLEQRARALEAEIERRKQAEREIACLFRLSDAANGAAALGQIFEPAIDAVSQLLSVERASILLFDSAYVMRFVAHRGLSETYRAAVDGHSPWHKDTKDPQPIFVADVDQDEAWAAYRPLFRSERIRALGFVPLVHSGKLLGKFMVYSHEPREFTAHEGELARAVATQIAQAVAREALFEAERRARQAAERSAERTRRLQVVTSRLTRAMLPSEVATVMIEEGGDAVGALSCAVWFVDPAERRLVLSNSRGYSAATLERVSNMPLDPAIPIADAALTNAAVWLATPEEYAARYPASHQRSVTFADPNSLRTVAIACLPLVIEQRTLGVIAFSFSEPQRFADDDRGYLLALSQQCAQAVERARLFEAEQRARVAREDVLAVVSHDLRNPLSTIVMGAASLSALDAGDKTPRLTSTTERIQRATQRMSRLIDDLLDFGSIQSGQLAIAPKEHAANDLALGALETFQAAAEERDIRMDLCVAADAPAVACDYDRVVQALSNLLSNALRFTPAGGSIVIGAEPLESEVVFFVKDSGAGIAEEELPHLFERYWRGKKSRYKGVGLGLTIAKGIVAAHGGRIWVESKLGEGAQFFFTLPRAL